jgi:carboxypeptidase family protein
MKRAAFVLATILFVSFVACAQDTATIVGSVTDSTGGVIPSAKVTVSNPLKGYTRDLVTNSAGEYTAAKIPIGDYVVTGEAKGFQKLVRSGITLDAGQTLRVDLQMKLGQVTQEVQVTGEVARVETETSALSDVVTSRQIENLNLNGLNFLSLTTLVPGAAPDNSMTAAMHLGHSSSTASVSFNGNREEYSNLEIDGANNSDEGSGANGGDTTPALDSIAEFRISTSNYGADIGQHAGAIIEVATKGGTKDFHGDAYEFVRNDTLDANDWFINQQIAPPGGNAPKTPLKWNIFGYTLGGPVYIPNHYNTDKTKTFFFWSEQWARYREGTVVNNGTPSLRMRQGDFSECDPASPNANAFIISQGCTLPTVNGVVRDTVPVDPNAAALLAGLVPLPNNGVDGYVASHSLPTNYREEQIRVDQNISDKASVFVRFTNDTWDRAVTPALWSGSSFDTTVTDFKVPARSAALHLTYSFRPNLMNEFIMGFADDPHVITPETGPSSPAHSVLKPSTWTANNLFPPNKNNPLLPAVSVGGGTPFSFYEDSGAYSGPYNTNPILTFKDNVAWTLGKHTVKFGFYLEKYQKNEQFGSDTQGSFSFFTGPPISSGNALADMYLGNIEQYTEGTLNVNGVPVGGYGKGHWRRTDFEPYFEDDWKVTPRLTLNLGVRYYLFIPFHDVTNPTVDASFIPALYNPALEALLDSSGNLVLNPATGHVHDFTTYGNGLVQCGAGGILAGCVKPYYNGIGPRFGFAFDPTGTGKTSIRGGYGIYFEPGNGNESNTEGLEGNPPNILAPSGFNIVGYGSIVPNGGFGPPGINTLPYYQKPPSVQQFNVNVQHEFSGNNLLTVSYVGTLGRHLATSRNLNQLPFAVKTLNAPELANLTGTVAANPSLGAPGDAGNALCDALGNCDVQQTLMFSEVPNVHFVPYRGYAHIYSKQNTAVSSYSALQANFRHTTGYGLTFQASYTWAHMIDDSTSTYFATGVDDNFNLSRWKATADLNRTHVLVMNYIYNLPFFKSASNSVARQALGGWQISGVTSFFTGLPVDFGCGVSGYNTGIGGGVRCNTVGPLKIKKGRIIDPQFGPMDSWFDPTVIAQPFFSQLAANGEPGMFGFGGRNALTGPGRNNWDLALHKEFQLPWYKGEHSTLQFRAETFNTFNHPQWNGINIGCSSSIGFGQPCTQPGNAEVSGAWAPRNAQFGLKFLF